MALEKQIVTKYFKCIPFEQPTLTSNTSHEGIVLTTSDWTSRAFQALNGITYVPNQTSDYSKEDGWTAEGSTGWWQVKFPYKLRIKKLTHWTNSFYNSDICNLTGRFYTSKDKITPLGNQFTCSKYSGSSLDIPVDSIITDTIYFEKSSGHAWSGIGELVIDADILVEADESDYDFTTTETRYVAKIRKNESNNVQTYKRVETKYYNKNVLVEYTLPQMTSKTTPEGEVVSNISSGSWSKEPYLLFWGEHYYFACDQHYGSNKYLQYNFKKPLSKGNYTLSFHAVREPYAIVPECDFIIIYDDDTSETVYIMDDFPTTGTNYSQDFVATKNIKSFKVFMPTVNYGKNGNMTAQFKNLKLEREGGLFAVNVGEVREISKEEFDNNSENTDYYSKDFNIYKIYSA